MRLATMIRFSLCVLLVCIGETETSEGETVSCDKNDPELKTLVTKLRYSAKEYPFDKMGFQMLLFLRDQIIEKEKDNGVLEFKESRAKAAERFTPWAKIHYNVDGIDIVWNEKFGLSLVANRDLEKNFEVTTAKTEHVISTQTIVDRYKCMDDVTMDYNIHRFTWMSKTLIVEVLVQALKNDSFFRPYINIFPKVYNTPVHFSFEDFRALNGSIVFDDAVYSTITALLIYSKVWLRLDSDKDCAKEIGITSEQLTLKSFLWAYSVVISRQYNGHFTQGEVNKVLVPVYDLANHAEDYTVYTQNFQEGEDKAGKPFGYYSTKTVEKINKGDELWNSYMRTMDPKESFDSYGFVNMQFYPLKLDIAKDSDYKFRNKMIKKYLENSPIIYLWDPEVSERMISAAELEGLLVIALANQEAVYSPANVRKIWNYLEEQLDKVLGRFLLPEIDNEFVETPTRKLIREQVKTEMDLIHRIKKHLIKLRE